MREAAAWSVAVWHGYMRLDPEAVPLLEWLRPRVGVALITNFDHPPHVRSVLNDWGLAPLFRAIAVSGELGVSKPDPAIFHWTPKAVGLEPNEVAFVGDSDADVQGAKASGCHPVRIHRGSLAGRPEGHDDSVATIAGLSEIPRVLGLP